MAHILLGEPDLVIEMPSVFHVPATGTIEYQYTLVNYTFTQDTWIAAAEMRPGNSQVVHHGEVWVRPPGSKWMTGAKSRGEVLRALSELRRMADA